MTPPADPLAYLRAKYEPLLALQPRDGVRLQADQAYGPHARQVLDVYQPDAGADASAQTGTRAGSRTGASLPVLVYFHGGGFIRGDKRDRANVGWHFARAGCLTLLPSYRLAPENCWPSGPEDVAAVWQWVREHARRFGGDPDRIVLVGESAGAAHVAAATLMRRFQPPGWAVAGAVLLSGPYNARLEGLARAQFGIATPDPRNEAYFGADQSAWPAASIVDHVDAAPLPLLISTAERDLPQMQVQGGELFARLVSQHGFAPEWQCLRDHDHFSQGFSIGTPDTSVSAPLLDFVRRVCGE